jgi:hypothetical protein
MRPGHDHRAYLCSRPVSWDDGIVVSCATRDGNGDPHLQGSGAHAIPSATLRQIQVDAKFSWCSVYNAPSMKSDASADRNGAHTPMMQQYRVP